MSKERPILTDEFFWQVTFDDDGPGADSFREGKGIDRLADVLREHMESEHERTPDESVPSGNISIYFNAVVDRWEPVTA